MINFARIQCRWCRRSGVALKRTLFESMVCVDGKSCDDTLGMHIALGELGDRDDSESDVLVMRDHRRPGWITYPAKSSTDKPESR